RGRDLGDNDAYVYWNDIRTAINLARTNGFIRFDSLASSRGDTATDVELSVSNGTGLVLYRGTATANWYRPFAVNPAACLSGKRLPIILSITCETMTLAPGESMVGEAWLKSGTSANPKGAVAFFGNTHSASNVALVRSAVARGFVTGLFSERRWHLGHACLRAKEQLYAEYPSYTSDYRGFNLLGDPELGVWTGLPCLPQVAYPAQIEPVPQSVPVTVTLDGTPVESALVCLSMDTSVYVWGYTDPQGTIRLDVNPVDTGPMRLVVTGRNLYPYDSVIHVGEVGISENSVTKVGHLQLSVTPAVFSRTTRFAWDELTPATIFIRDVTGRLVRTLAARGTVEWDGNDQYGRQVVPGVYLARLVCGSVVSCVRLSKLR
ncbi:MAG: C25 family cysteine peptidase, partial [candidate division WOR-3 bacterium]